MPVADLAAAGPVAAGRRVTSPRREPAGALTDVSSPAGYRGGAACPQESHDTTRCIGSRSTARNVSPV